MPNQLQLSGGTPQKQPKYAPLLIDKAFTGLYTQRNPLHDPSSVIETKFYGGRPDALWSGINVELTNRLTLQRRPGLSPFSPTLYPAAPNTAFSFELTNGTIQVIVDTASTGSVPVLAVNNALGGNTIYEINLPTTVTNVYVGLKFQITGCANGQNNGIFTCIASNVNNITLDNAFGVLELSSPGSAISGGGVYYDPQVSLAQLLFAKAPNAGQTFFVAVAGILYAGDGVETWIYTPGGANGSTWLWGIAAPTSQPNVIITPSGSAAIAWAANTIFSTMGLIVDPNGNTQQLYSVNGLGNNPAPAALGTSGNGAPPFNTTTGATTVDGSVTWTSQGPITLWVANTAYASGAAIYDPVTNCIFVQSHSTSRTSGVTKPTFNSTLGLSGARIDDTNTAGTGGGNARWECLGTVALNPTAIQIWAKNTHFNLYQPPSGGGDPSNVNSAIVYPLIPNTANMTAYMNGTGPAIYLLGATTAGNTANTDYTPWSGIVSQIVGDVTLDNQLEWLCLGNATWAASTTYSQWTTPGAIFSCIKDSNGNMQVCTILGTSGSIQPTWNTGYGSITQDNGVSWTCVGVPVTWAVTTQWDLPIVGFSPPSKSQPYGGSEVIGSNFVQSVISSGKSGGSTPSWSITIGNNTTDNGITWQTVAAYSQNSLAWTSGYVYAYSYEARLPNDIYNTTAPPGLKTPLGSPTGSETGDISTASPVFTITGADTGAVNTVSGIGSTNPAVDTIVIWRSADGGGPSNMFFLTEIPAPPPIAGVAQPWSFSDFLPDSATALFPGLNELISSPIDDQNDQPPSNFLPMVYNFQRIWGGSGQSVVWSGGPDIEQGAGNPQSAFNPADNFPYLANVVQAKKTAQGLIVFLTDSIQIIAGGPATATFYTVEISSDCGLTSPNAIDQYGGELTFFTADSEFKTISPQLSLTNSGFPLGDKFAQWAANTVYVATQQAGVDNCIFVADGSTGWYRVNPRQVPGGYAGVEPVWSPKGEPVGGCKMVVSVETTPGIKKLLVGATTGGKQILYRNLSTFTDNGNLYDANFQMGSIVLCSAGQLAALRFIEADFSLGTTPKVSYLLNEIAGTPTSFGTYVFEPPSIYGSGLGPYGKPTSYLPARYYWAQTGGLARCRHFMLYVDFGQTSNGDELIGLTIYGRLMVEL